MTRPVISVIVPSYNSAPYLERCLDSLVDASEVEIIVVDDGSTDETARIAQTYAQRFPDTVSLLSKANGGHGSAINAGLDAARGEYVKIVDSDDWLDRDAFRALIADVQRLIRTDQAPDLVVTNYVYEKDGRRSKPAVRYRGVLPQFRVFGWEEVGRFRRNQYFMMHSLLYRASTLRASGLRLPEHTFYVDSLFVTNPLPFVETLYYADLDLYRYHIGRIDQSVNEAVMLKRMDQQVKVTRMLIESVPSAEAIPSNLHRYLVRHVGIVFALTSLMLIRHETKDGIIGRANMWEEVKQRQPELYAPMRKTLVGQVTNLPGSAGRRVSVMSYKLTRLVVGF